MRTLFLILLVCLGSASHAQPAGSSSGGKASVAETGNVSQNGPAIPTPIYGKVDSLNEPEVDQPDPYARERNERERRDIIAQERTANWSHWMFWAMIGQTLLAGGALIALVRDLRQNRRSSEAQLRAYVRVKAKELRTGFYTGQIEANLQLLNDGATPAYDCAHNGNIVAMTRERAEQVFTGPEEWRTSGTPNYYPLHPGEDDCIITIGPDDPIPLPILKKVSKDELGLFVFGNIIYKDTFGTDRRTRFCYQIEGFEMPPAGTKIPQGEFIKTPADWRLMPFHNDAT